MQQMPLEYKNQKNYKTDSCNDFFRKTFIFHLKQHYASEINDNIQQNIKTNI